MYAHATRLACIAAAMVASATIAALPARATTFGFDALTATNAGVPFSVTSGGITASFSSPTGNGVFIAESGAGFSTLGSSALSNDTFSPAELDIGFSPRVSGISFRFATEDFGAATKLTLAAYNGTALVATVSATGNTAASLFPEGLLSLQAASFSSVRITDAASPGFAIGAVTVPEPATAGLFAAGILGLFAKRRSAR